MRLSMFVALCGAFMLSGCKTALLVDLHLDDLLKVHADRTTVATAPARLSVVLDEAADCDRSPDGLRDLLEGYFHSPALYACDATDAGALLTLQVLLPVYPTTDAWQAAEEAVFGIYPQPTEGRIQIDVLYNDEAMQRLNDSFEAAYGKRMVLGDLTLGLRLHNDSSDLKVAQLSASIINGEPFLNFQRFLVLPDEPVEIIVGSVKIAYMKRHGYAPVVQVLTFDENIPMPEQEG